MTTWALLAPGPSASAAQAESVRAEGMPVGVVGNAFQLAPWAEFIAATDSAWWKKYPEAKELMGRKFTMHAVPGAESKQVPSVGGVCNSGVLALECALLLGSTKILLLGFDMHGSHFFGQYENGLSNTDEVRRKVHVKQYDRWRRAHPGIQVMNCTVGSRLKCFPEASLEEALMDHAPEKISGRMEA